MSINFNKSQRRLIKHILAPFQKRAKVDLYQVFVAITYLVYTGLTIECVKSNFGTSQFKPISGRWVMERTNSWLENFRRLCRNYERYLMSARAMTYIACILFMLRYI